MLLCRKLDLFGRELLAVDGTRLKAVNSTDRNFTHDKLVKMIRSADERLADYLTRLDRTDAEKDGEWPSGEEPDREDRGVQGAQNAPRGVAWRPLSGI